ncbi:MAG: PEGA domain-containing protein [Deltaproteobacteria bacterium]|nr:PEGA domain-containing protein [Deltaproteobacteria bacterium]
MLRRSLVVCISTLLLLALGADAAAKKKKARPRKAAAIRVMILPVQVKGLSADRARTLGKDLGKSMIHELQDIGIFRVLADKRSVAKLRQLRKKKIYVRDCHAKRGCLRKVGRSLNAKVVYHMQVAKAREGVTVTMRTFDVRSGKEVRKAVARMDTDDPVKLERQSRWLARKVSSPMITTLLKGKGRLKIDCQEGGADLFINGKSFGKKTNRSFKVSSGVFDIKVKKEGFAEFHDVVVVKPKQEKVVVAALEPVDKTDALVADAGKPGPGETKPGETKPDETKPDETKPDETKPDETKPDETKPGETKPDETKPDETKPDETKPDETKPEKELPPWALFERPKKPKEETKPAGEGGTSVAGGGAVGTGGEKPFMPTPEPEPVKDEDEDKPGPAWYKTWWFWTIVGVGVAGAAAGVSVALLAGGGEPAPETGSAILSWD